MKAKGQLIGVTGYAEHGKDSIGKVLVSEFGFKRFAFADILKSMALALNPYVDSEYTLRLYQLVQDQGWDRAKKENAEVRRFLQALGTEGVRDHIGEDAWVDALEKALLEDGQLSWKSRQSRPLVWGNVVVTDVRFLNEAAWVKRLSGRLWRVTRLNADGTVYDNGLGTDHPSERYIAQLPVDTEIAAYTIEDLKREVREVMGW